MRWYDGGYTSSTKGARPKAKQNVDGFRDTALSFPRSLVSEPQLSIISSASERTVLRPSGTFPPNAGKHDTSKRSLSVLRVGAHLTSCR